MRPIQHKTTERDAHHAHGVPDRPWAKISTDPIDLDLRSYMVTVDYFSGFFEMDRLYDLKISPVIRTRRHIWQNMGFQMRLCRTMVCSTREFKKFAK